jgi:phosphatidylglycerophosphate synthase
MNIQRLTGYPAETLRQVYWKSCSHEGYLNIYIYRRLSLAFAVLFAKLRGTPNQVTILSFLMSLLSAMMFMPGDYRLALYGLIPFHLGKILDCADGQLAKLTNKTSALGAFLDPFFDRIIDIAIMGSLVAFYQINHDGSLLALYLFTATLATWFVSTYLDKQSGEGMANLENLRKTTGFLPPVLRRMAKYDGGFIGLATTLAIIFDQIPLFLGMSLAVAFIPVPMTLLGLLRRLKKQ